MVRSTVTKTKENTVSRLVYNRDIKELLSILVEGGDASLSITTYEIIYSTVRSSWEANNDGGYLSPDVTISLEKQGWEQRAAAAIRLSEYLCATRAVENYGRGAHRQTVRDGIFDCMYLLELFQLKLVGRHAGDFISMVSTIRLGSDSYESWLKKRASESGNTRIKGLERVIRAGCENASPVSRKSRNAGQLTLFDIIHAAFELPQSRS